MIPYAIQHGDIKPQHLMALALAEEMLKDLPDGLSCHDVVRIFHERHPEIGKPVTGYWFKKLYGHSWIELDGPVVLDIYPIGQIKPILVVTGYWPIQYLYTEVPEE